ncbi:hypothetical protein OIU74_009399 [Salix koriyanagi]|uniref:Uncharacterized protein n=1 Tax=Salix koriyanagi TaxID=2511006 RepID=A0A9Q0TS93_9ROSI|nr:hypothetical protein OIU74_009399 [Salix koriyanagi]
MNSAYAVDFGSTDATAITHPRRRWLTGRVIPLGWNIEDVPLVGRVNVERRSVVPLLGKGSSIQPRIPLLEHIDIVINSDPSTADHGTFPPRVSYKFTLDAAGTSEVPPDGDARAMSTVFMCWSVMIVAFPGSMRIDELKEQKAINIVGESNIERKLWWDLGSIDMLMSRSVFLGRTCGSWPVARCKNLLMEPCA